MWSIVNINVFLKNLRCSSPILHFLQQQLERGKFTHLGHSRKVANIRCTIETGSAAADLAAWLMLTS